MKPRKQNIFHLIDKAGNTQPFFVYLAVVVFIGSLFGLRDVILTPLFVSLLKAEWIAQWLIPFYWLGLILSGGFLGIYLSRNPLRFPSPVRTKDILFWLLSACPFFYLVFTRRLFLDFWLDELISIVRHIQPSVKSAIFSYPVPNNHIFSNVISGIYLQLVGWHDLQEILKYPIVLRFLFLICGVFTILGLGYLAHTFFGKWAGRLAVVLLCTTIPFLNFIVQVRGYSFTLLFSVLILWFVLRYRESHQGWQAISIAGLSCFIFYTIPSNLYFLLAIILFLAVDGIVKKAKGHSCQTSLDPKGFILLTPSLTVLSMIILGVLLATLFYVPVFKHVTQNRFVSSKGLFQGTAFLTFPDTMKYFISGRFWIFVIAWIGVCFGWLKIYQKKHKQKLAPIYLSLSTFLLPFGISFVRGDQPFSRSFLVTLPAFILFSSFGLSFLLQWIKETFTENPWIPHLVFLIIYVSSNVIFLSTYKRIEDEIYQNLAHQTFDDVQYHDQRIWNSHFLEHYQVLHLIDALQDADEDLPVFLDADNTRYKWVVVKYLETFGYPLNTFQDPSTITVSEAFLIVSYPKMSIQKIDTKIPGTTCQPVTDELSIYRLFRCQFPRGK